METNVDETVSDAAVETRTRRTVAAFYAATRAMDVDAFAATFAADAVHEDPIGTPPFRGQEGVRQFFAGITGLMTTFGLTEDSVFVVGDTAAVKWTGRGIGTTGRAVTFEGIDVMEVNDASAIRHLRAYWDAGALMAHLQGATGDPLVP